MESPFLLRDAAVPSSYPSPLRPRMLPSNKIPLREALYMFWALKMNSISYTKSSVFEWHCNSQQNNIRSDQVTSKSWIDPKSYEVDEKIFENFRSWSEVSQRFTKLMRSLLNPVQTVLFWALNPCNLKTVNAMVTKLTQNDVDNNSSNFRCLVGMLT